LESKLEIHVFIVLSGDQDFTFSPSVASLFKNMVCRPTCNRCAPI